MLKIIKSCFKTSHIIIFLIGMLSGGYLIIIIKKHSHFNIENNISIGINPIEIFSIIMNIFIAYYLTVVFGKKNDIDKSERDILIQFFEDFRKDKDLIIAESIDVILSGNQNTNLNFITSQFKYLRQKLNMNLNLLVDRKIILNNDVSKQNAEAKMRDIWQKITYTPTLGQQNYIIENELSNARRFSTELDKLLFELIIRINNK
ncbi:hypothetical protein SAMN05444143_1374 [Flavobacterium succinicans]|uniref:Uncharacterized protein n=1 Tax=Flavobacterium succinicans TaxID=29536 RepID=A0A1I5AEA6_9FLAO|nr:hypothetical protein [Flavobacterium succinicans]SFN60758.1 hypothetical protein SAMN05444143_1374 [Flavobacterium succinicans]